MTTTIISSSINNSNIKIRIRRIYLNIFKPIFHYIYAFSRHFYPKRLTMNSGYTFFLSVCVLPGNWTHNLLRC